MTRAPRIVAIVVVATMIASCDSPPPATPPTNIATGSVPNALALTTCGDRRVAVVAVSGGARVNVIDLDDGSADSHEFAVGSNPWDVVIADTAVGPRAIVSLYGTAAVALVDPCSAPPTQLHTIGDDVAMAVEPAVTNRAGDVVTSMLPANPQALAVAGDVVWLAWTNIIDLAVDDEPMRTGPGLLSRFRIDNDHFVDDGRVVLPCDNPAAIAVDDRRVVVSCTGRYGRSGDGHTRASDGAIVVVDPASLAVVDHVELEASPVSLRLHDGDIVVGDALDGTVRRFDAALLQQQSTGASADIESVFALDVVDGVVVAAGFGARDFVLVDPFGANRRVDIAPTRGRGIVDMVSDGDDGDIFLLMTLSSEIVRLPREEVATP